MGYKWGGDMKLATRKNGTLDGELLIIKQDLGGAISAADIVPTLQQALEMPIGNRKELEEILIDKISDQDVIDWANKLFSDLNVYLD